MRHTRRTAVMLLAVTVATVGCGERATGRTDSSAGAGSSARPGPVSEQQPTTTTVPAPSMTKSTTPVYAGAAAPATPTAQVVAPEMAVEDIESMLGGLDDTLAELDQLLNQTAAAMAAEEGEMIQ